MLVLYQTTGFSDFPYLVKKGRDMRRFPCHTELLLYINDFCEYFGLREIIRFNTRVDHVGSWIMVSVVVI